MTQNDQAAMNEKLTQLRLQVLSIDGDNRYKQDLIDAVIGAMMFGAQGANPPPAGHWLEQFYVIGREERQALARVEADNRQLQLIVNSHANMRDTAQAQLAEAVGLLRTLIETGHSGWAEDCQECAIGRTKEWRSAKAFLARHAPAAVRGAEHE